MKSEHANVASTATSFFHEMVETKLLILHGGIRRGQTYGCGPFVEVSVSHHALHIRRKRQTVAA